MEIHKQKGLQLCIKALMLRDDYSAYIERFVDSLDAESSFVEPKTLVQLMRDECRSDGQFTIDQLYGIAEMLTTFWMKEDSKSVELDYSKTPTIYNALLHFVDYGTLAIKNNLYVVCRCESLLRWHTLSSVIGEDLLVCAYLASYDLHNVQVTTARNNFSWPAYIRTDDPTLESILEMPLVDIHAHLKGSSLNFDINWICLMNRIKNRKEQFDDLSKFAQGIHHERRLSNSLYGQAVKAAAIRLYLFQLTINDSIYSVEELKNLLKMKDDGALLNKVSTLQESIETALNNYGKEYANNETGDSARFDYAIRNGLSVPLGRQETCAYSLLSGERYLLYCTLKGIYNGDYIDGRVAMLLHAYILIKNEIRHELSQLNDSVGFENFSIYEERKLIFAKEYSEYKKAAIHLAVASFFGEHHGNRRYHEMRITPEVADDGKNNAVKKNINEINSYDSAIEDRMFKTKSRDEDFQWPYRYIYHFIKQKDDTKDEMLNVMPRHHNLRETVKKQSLGIFDLRNSLYQNKKGEFYADRIVGIDAANSEVACRPEVFAQAFRFLRRHQIKKPELHRPADLGITYHVGEDFMDVVDGLRAVDEAIQFLQLQKGDRIGHGLVLGVDVKNYYQLRNHTVALSLQMQMDNAVWLWYQMCKLGLYSRCKDEMVQRFESCFRRIYPHYNGTPSIGLYYSSMLLRGDNPECYDANGCVCNPHDRVTGWGNKALVRSKLCDEARGQKEACRLYYLYHYDKEGKINGRIFDTWEVDLEMCQAIDTVQQHLLQQVEHLGIAIECNPTSNFKIGEIDRYDCHPITKFKTINRNDHYSIHDISVSINTDDKGVFATSIEREYALIAHALIRKYRYEENELNDTDVYEWIDKIRRHSLNQRFDKNVQLQNHLEEGTLLDLKKKIEQEIRNDDRNKRFVDRLRLCKDILCGKKEG